MSMALEMQNCFKTKGGRRMFLFRLPLSSSTPSLALYKACFELRHYPLLRPLCGVNDSIPLFGAPKTDRGNLDLWRQRERGANWWGERQTD